MTAATRRGNKVIWPPDFAPLNFARLQLSSAEPRPYCAANLPRLNKATAIAPPEKHYRFFLGH